MAVNKWGVEYWTDTAERVGTTALYGVAVVITGELIADVNQWWLVVGLPSSLSLIKCLLMNMRGTGGDGLPTASVVKVRSAKEEVVPNA